jgi:hypothetical protein
MLAPHLSIPGLPDGLRSFGIFYGHLVNVAVIWYIFPVLVCFTYKNLATLVDTICSFFWKSLFRCFPNSIVNHRLLETHAVAANGCPNKSQVEFRSEIAFKKKKSDLFFKNSLY